MRFKVIFTYAMIFCVIGVIAAAGGYTAWNVIDPAYTCAQCHEIKPTHERWLKSAHSKVACVECHGTAISNGLHSLKEKIGMLTTHISSADKIRNRDIKMTEAQVLETSSRCANCHKAEFAKWKSGAHSTNYANIFEDKIHNKMERPYWDCFRCHGMFYDGNIETLMSFQGDCDNWKIKCEKQAKLPAIPCLACHQVHTEKKTADDFKDCYQSRNSLDNTPKTALYIRAEKMCLRSDKLQKVKMYLDGKPVKISDDPNHRLCMQCHSPDYRHNVRSQDDRTPSGAHEGFSCLTCHDPHSNSAAQSCAKCHDQSVEKYKFKSGVCPQIAKQK